MLCSGRHCARGRALPFRRARPSLARPRDGGASRRQQQGGSGMTAAGSEESVEEMQKRMGRARHSWRSSGWGSSPTVCRREGAAQVDVLRLRCASPSSVPCSHPYGIRQCSGRLQCFCSAAPSPPRGTRCCSLPAAKRIGGARWQSRGEEEEEDKKMGSAEH